MTKPHPLLEVRTPDEVAETWDNVPVELCNNLWSLTNHYTKYDRKDCGPHDVIGVNSIASFWKLLSTKDQMLLNILARKQESEIKKLYSTYYVKLILSSGNKEWMENSNSSTNNKFWAKRFTTPTQAKDYVEKYWACDYEIISNQE